MKGQTFFKNYLATRQLTTQLVDKLHKLPGLHFYELFNTKLILL